MEVKDFVKSRMEYPTHPTCLECGGTSSDCEECKRAFFDGDVVYCNWGKHYCEKCYQYFEKYGFDYE